MEQEERPYKSDDGSMCAPLQVQAPDISKQQCQGQQQEHEQEQDHVSTIDPALLPVNWPRHVKYLVDYEYHPAIDPAVLDLVQGRRRKKSERQDQDQSTILQAEEERCEEESAYDEIPIGHAIPGPVRSLSTSSLTTSSTASLAPPPPYEIRLITSPPHHPVLGSFGLFATEALRPGRHLLDYISLVVPDAFADPESDHTLYLSNDLNLDASVHGNHGRFVNDFRGIRSHKEGPNVGWDLYRDAETGQIRMGCKVLKKIRRGKEILCTYGKAYWKSRGIAVKGSEWEDGWDTDLDDWSSEEEGIVGEFP
ncbi:hypothetical protein BGZ99_010377 [Dissophora globulifera]|uniref:SET domain-containing protein n=1 Tax=Dissophora globulifera TaxID=979702 RepID=A0A9P6RRS3_9FUNG|nr:hypothetical protein BGZ99_010377 [Dissophora globulifera]